MDFTFYTAGEIIFGRGKVRDIGAIASRFGRKAMICYRGKNLERAGILAKVLDSLSAAGISYMTMFFPSNEPQVEEVDLGAEQARNEKPDVIIGVGGGSAIDTAKAISGLVTNPGSVADYLEGVGRGRQITNPSVPYIAVPTTAGTGAEVTKNAVISSKEQKFKKSVRSPHLIPNVALLDPELTITLPAKMTAETGMDALTQLIESYVSSKAQPIPEALAIYGIRMAGKYLARAVQDGQDIEAREGMLLASLLSGIALANSGLGAAHGIAAALGAVAQIPHGRACAMLLPKVMRLNLPACEQKFADIGEALGARASMTKTEKAEEAVRVVERLCRAIGIPPKFAGTELSESMIPAIVAGSRGSSMQGNPIVLSDEQIEGIVRELI